MFQGTASSAGKSLLTAALCRALLRRGIAVAPFKAQNMSLNSWVTATGEEMGIAQALQATACDREPDSRMNPVLLKPMGEKGSQVILLGRPLGTMSYREYIRLKPEIWQKVQAAYRSLCSEHEVIVLEGAGSPAEINLARHDIVNMAMARFAGAKVLLVSDIDRGGAFASICGTMALLRPAERRLVAGFILNKFRGDKSLLNPALETISARLRRPFFGVMPMLSDLLLPEEDSAGRLQQSREQSGADSLDIAVIWLPAMSNISDWDPLAAERNVAIRMVRKGDEFGNPDLVILPGSRNVPASLGWLRQSGLFEALQRHAAAIAATGRGEICGICAGLQILGEYVADPENLEGGGQHTGLGLLPFATVLQRQKRLARQEAEIRLGERLHACRGYEIHHGQLQNPAESQVCARGRNGEALAFGEVGSIWGTWLHGIFENDAFRHEFLARIAARAGKSQGPGRAYAPERELDRLADSFEENIDMRAILELLPGLADRS